MQTRVSVPSLSRNGNWVAWEVKIAAYLSSLTPPLDEFLYRRPTEGDEDERDADKKCRNILILHVDSDLCTDIKSCVTASEAFDTLKVSLLHQLAVRGQIINQKISELHQGKRSTDAYLRHAQSLMIEAQDVGETTYMRNLCARVIKGLNPKLLNLLADNLMTTIETSLSADSTESEISTIFNTLEQRIRSRAQMFYGTEYAVDEQQGEMFAVQGGFPSHQPTQQQPDPQVPKEPPLKRPDIEKECWYCGKKGHMRRNCRKMRADQEKQQQQQQNAKQAIPQHVFQMPQKPAAMQVEGVANLQQQIAAMQKQLNQLSTAASTADAPNGGPSRMYSTRAIVTRVQHFEGGVADIWLDGGATHHVVTSKHMLSRTTASNVNSVLVAAGDEHQVTCCGNLSLQTPHGTMTLTGVLCVPDFVVHLISVPQLDDQGYSVLHHDGRAIVRNNTGDIVVEGAKAQGLYKLDCKVLSPPAAHVNVVAEGASLKLLHRRLGHPGMRATKELMNGNAVIGLMHDEKACAEDYCEVCRNAKEHRAHFAPSTNPPTAPLQVIHSDVMGPFKCKSSGGHVYSCSVYDQYTGYGEMLLLKAKSEVNINLRYTIYRWQRQTGLKVKCIRTDRGKEYEGSFQRFLRREGIIHQRSAAYTPEQNGVAERYNRTVIVKVRAMLNEFNLPTFLWGEAMRTATYLLNLLPKKGHTLSPYELMFQMKPSADHLRVFGCTVHMHVPKHQQVHKTDPTGKLGMFIGYAENSKSYRVMLWDTGRLHVTESASCTFAEHISPTISTSARRAIEQEVQEADDDDDWWYEQLVNLPVHRESGDANLEEVFDDVDLTTAGDDTDESEDEDAPVEEHQMAWDIENAEPSGPSDDAEPSGHSNDAEPSGPTETEGDDGEPTGPGAGRWPGRVRNAPDRLAYNVKAVWGKHDFDNPTMKQALQREDAPLWIEAINKELRSIFEKEVYDEVDAPADKRILTTRFVLHIKRDKWGNVIKYKARLVVRGNRQIADLDYSDVYAPTAQSATFRTLTALAVQRRLVMHQIDVSTALLNGVLEEEVYVRLPPQLASTKVWKLKKALYGLKQAARVWYKRLTLEITKLGFTQSHADPCLYYKGKGADMMYIIVHVDDAVLVGKQEDIEATKAAIGGVFEITDEGEAQYFLRIEILRSADGIKLSQEQYCTQMLTKYGMDNCNGKDTPMAPGTVLQKEGDPLPADNDYASRVGALLYLAVNTRPDISFAVGRLSKYMSCPTKQHLDAVNRVFRYLKKYPSLGLWYGYVAVHRSRYITRDSRTEHLMQVYGDADFAGDINTRKSTSGMVVLWGPYLLSWGSRMQSIVTTSTTEAELVAAAFAAKEGLWLKKLMCEVLCSKVPCFILHTDNEACLALIKNDTAGVSGRTKHIDVQYHFLRDRRMRGEIDAKHQDTAYMYADIFTKPMTGVRLSGIAAAIGLM
jgi:transposase InsO family protein